MKVTSTASAAGKRKDLNPKSAALKESVRQLEPADEKALRNRYPIGRPKRSQSRELVPRENGIRDRFLIAPVRPGWIAGARLIYKNGNYRLLVTLSWKQGEFTVTGSDDYEVREWRTAQQALQRLYEKYAFTGATLLEGPCAPSGA